MHATYIETTDISDVTLRGDVAILAFIGVALLVRASMLIEQSRRPDADERHDEAPAARHRRGVRTGIFALLFFAGALLAYMFSQITLF